MTCATCLHFKLETPSWGNCHAPVPDASSWSFEDGKKSNVLMMQTDGKTCPAWKGLSTQMISADEVFSIIERWNEQKEAS
jgi:hypothetical protein